MARQKNKEITSIYDFPKELLPRHIAIIMDGNGRWAKKRLMPRSVGHRAGVEQVKRVITMSSDIGLSALTLYAFSTENWKRPKDEVGILMSLLLEYLKKEIDELHANNVKLCTLGDIENLPREVYEAIVSAQQKTKDNTGLVVNIAVNYGARAEMVRCTKKIAQLAGEGKLKPEEIDEQLISNYLYTSHVPDPDLIIRTSGELRISNFLLYQMAYSELYFTDALWPDFDEQEYLKALLDYKNRKRRFGSV